MLNVAELMAGLRQRYGRVADVELRYMENSTVAEQVLQAGRTGQPQVAAQMWLCFPEGRSGQARQQAQRHLPWQQAL